MPQFDETTEVEVPDQTEASEVEPGDETPQPEEDLFYDATKVPEALQPTFRDMQAAWTKKTQDAAASLKRFEDYGSVDEVASFLDQFQSTDGVLAWWFNIADQLGVPREALGRLLKGGTSPEGGEPDEDEDLLDPSEKRIRQLEQQLQGLTQAQQQSLTQQQEAQEAAEVDSALKEYEVTEEEADIVLLHAFRQPAHLGYRERIKRGVESARGSLDQVVQKRAAASKEKRDALPTKLGGTLPTTSAEAPKTFAEARKRSLEMMDQVFPNQ